MNKLYISKQVNLLNNKVYIDNQEVFSNESEEAFSTFAKSVYKNYNLKYSKFYKMDALSKLGFLATDLLLQNINRENINADEIAIICANSSASLHNDTNYQKTISKIPSPGVFVYTLPNIVLGEICIRNDIKGESLFFIQEKFDTEFMSNYINYLFENTKTKLCITGWTEMETNESYQADLYLIPKEPQNLSRIFQSINA